MNQILKITSTILSLLMLNVFMVNASNNEGIDFKDLSFNKALKMAKKENKLVFVDCYTEWCGPCKYLAKEIFTQKEVGVFFNDKFICLKLNMEKGEGIDLKNQFGISSFPTLLWLNSKGEIVHKAIGSCSAEDLLKRGQDAIGDSPYSVVEKRVLTNQYSKEDLISYLKVNRRAQNADSLVNILFNMMTDEEFVSSEGMNLAISYVKDLDSPILKRIIDNEEAFKAKLGTKYFNHLHSIFTMYVARNNRLPGFALTQLEKFGHQTGINAYYDYVLSGAGRTLKQNKNEEEYIQYYLYALKDWLEIRKPGATRLNNEIINICSNYDDERLIEFAEKLVQESYKVDKTRFWAIHSDAQICRKKGNLKKALELENDALSLVKETHPQDKYSISVFEKSVSKIKAEM